MSELSTKDAHDSRVLVTGASGFIGRALVARLVSDGVSTRAAIRGFAPMPDGVEVIRDTSLESSFYWRASMTGIRTVVHAAARVHQTGLRADDAATFHRVNVEGTMRLARAAAQAGARRFVFLSSIKVNGEQTPPGRPFTTDDAPHPADPYAQSKTDAETGLKALAAETGLELVVIRPVLVYGPGVKANMLRLMQWIDRRLPLPFGAVHNARSLVGLDNLVDLIALSIDHPAAPNEILLVSDGEDLSTPDLLRRLGRALGRPARLTAVPLGVVEAAASLFRRKDMVRPLTSSLQVDISRTRARLAWTPPISVDEGLARMAAAYRARANR